MDAAGPRRPPRVRVVTLNWNAAELTARCLRSLLATDWPADALDLVVVDNASIDGSLERLRAWFAGSLVRFVANPANLGFAEGCNTAMRDLDGVDMVALVNNDAVVEPGWLAPLVAALESDPGLGAVAPKLLLATPYAELVVEAASPAEVVAVEVDGLDVTGRCLWGEGVETAPEGTVPLLLRHRIDRRGVLAVPVPERPRGPVTATVVLRTEDPFRLDGGGTAGGEGGGPRTAVADGGVARATVEVTSRPAWRINNLGTDRTPWHEGLERRFGEPDDPAIAPEEPAGWCGGGVLLRADYLRDVGWFDPRFFAYYEDTDLSWRGRRAGWRYRTEPASVLRHVHGGTAGSAARGFFLLNYRNWLLTALRNGDRGEVAATLRWARHLAWGPTLTNVLAPLRRLRRPAPALSVGWAAVAATTAAAAPRVLGSRRTAVARRIGSTPTRRVRSVLQTRPAPRPPTPRVGGPVVTYVDVTSALASGWRAGIQRVTLELVRRLPLVADVDVVAITWSEVDGRYRRLAAAEWAHLLDPAATGQAPPPVPRSALTAAERTVLDASAAVARLPRGVRPSRWVARLRRPAAVRQLLLPRFEAGSVFLDVDASWNVVAAPRRGLLPRLRAEGVRVVCFAHDVLPETHPDWFPPELVAVFGEHLRAHADHADAFVCNSAHTRDQVAAFVARRRPDRSPGYSVCPLGGDPPAPPTDDGGAAAPPGLGDGPVALVVGTIEPRKDHATLLAAWRQVASDVPGAQLVVVGREGWHAEDVVDELRRAEADGLGVTWRSDAHDGDLAALYRRADVVVVPSRTEGYGLPVVEALAAGRATVASTGGALGEVGGDAVARFEPGDADRLAAHLRTLLGDPAERQRLEAAARRWSPPSWDDTAAAVAEALLPPVRPAEPGRDRGPAAAAR